MQTPLDRRGGMASSQSNSTFSLKIIWQARGMSSLQSNSTFSVKQHFAGKEAWPAWRAILLFHSKSIWLARRHAQLAEQFYFFNQTPLDKRGGIPSLQSNSTFSFKHHLTGEDARWACRAILPFIKTRIGRQGVWPACKAILPFHANTTLQASRHTKLAE